MADCVLPIKIRKLGEQASGKSRVQIISDSEELKGVLAAEHRIAGEAASTIKNLNSSSILYTTI